MKMAGFPSGRLYVRRRMYYNKVDDNGERWEPREKRERGEDMARQDVLDFYQEDHFFEGDIEEGLTALLYEPEAGGDYVIVTDGNGEFPEDLDQEIIVALYREDGAFQWSVTVENSRQFREIWRREPLGGVAAVEAFRRESPYYEPDGAE